MRIPVSRLRSWLLSAAVLMLAASAHAAECEMPQRLRFSMVPEGSIVRDLAAYRPLLDELQRLLRIPVDTVVPASYGSVVEGLLSGAIDFAKVGPATYVTVKKSDPDIRAFATISQHAGAFREEGGFYHSLLIVANDRMAHSIASLRGKQLALVDPDSTSGALIPRKAFPDLAGASVERHFGRVSYAGNHNAAALAVKEKRVTAAFVSSSHLSALVKSGQAAADDFKVLWQSPPIPSDAFVYRGQLCKSITEKIEHVFLSDFRRNGRAVDSSFAPERFAPVTDRDYDVIRQLAVQ